MRTSGRTALRPKPNLHRTGPGEGKKHLKRGAKGLSLSLSPMRACTRSLFLFLSTPTRWGAFLFESLDQRALTPQIWIFPLASKESGTVTLMYLRAITRSV